MVTISSKSCVGISAAVLCGLAGLLLGLLIGFLSSNSEESALEILEQYMTDQWVQDGGDDISSRTGRSPADIIDMISTENIDKNLLELARKPHLAGTQRDEELAKLIQRRFQDAGFDDVQMPAMNFLLSRPDSNNPNLVRIYDGKDKTVFSSHFKEEPLHKDDEDPNFVHAFNAYTPRGNVYSTRGEGVVYVNYGRIEDFHRLEDLGVNISGKIAMMRYGKIFRGNKVTHAAEYGAIGVIIFSDPKDVARDGQDEKNVYPYTVWLPGTGIQRGSTFLGDGDPLTPGWPSIDDAYRVSRDKAGLPTIPAQPIGYADARQILMRLGGPEAPSDWQGGIGVTYNLGPQFSPQYADHILRLNSNNAEVVVKSYNVIGVINGAIEPDRYILIGNHRDAWGYGAIDPSSGTAQLLETARVLGQLKANGWRPRRTLIFCSWGSEEYGLIGSTEWVEEHIDRLQGRAVTYLNTDTCASGQYVQLRSSPILFDTLKKIAGMIPGVRVPDSTLLQEWVDNDKKTRDNAKSYPIMKTLGSGSDFAKFTFYAGIPAADIWFRKNQAEHKGSYASYHTGFDTYFMISNNTDPGFKAIQGCGRFASLFLKYMSDSKIIPFNLSYFPSKMLDTLNSYETNGNAKKLREIFNKYDKLLEAVQKLEDKTNSFQSEIENVREPMKIRRVNDQLMKFEQAFVIPGGLPGRAGTRHAVFAPSKFDNYASAAFPGITDLLYKYDDLTGDEKEVRNEEIRRHINLLTVMTHRAIGVLRDPTKFY